MRCARCSEERGESGPWCPACEQQYDTWIRQHATDIIKHAGTGAVVAMAVALPLLAIAPVMATLGVLAGFSTFLGLRHTGKRRRRQQFLGEALPRAYLPHR